MSQELCPCGSRKADRFSKSSRGYATPQIQTNKIWILNTKNMPQIRLNEREAIAFLTLRF